MAWQKVASFSEIADQSVLGVEVDGVAIALYRDGDDVFATQGICTHAFAYLSQGWLEDCTIECPLHQGTFDIRTGKALCGPVTKDLKVYPVKRDSDDILIDVAGDQQAENDTHEETQRPATSETPTLTAGPEAPRSEPQLLATKDLITMPTQLQSVVRSWDDDLSEIPDWVYTDQAVYDLEVERIFHGATWNYVAFEQEVPEPGNFIRSNVGPTPVIVARADDGSIHVFENRCSHRAAELCRDLRGKAKEFVCPYHQWTYDLKGNLTGIPFRRGVNGLGGMPPDFRPEQHGLRQLSVTTHRGVVFASYSDKMESLADYFGPEIMKEFEATFDGRKLKILGHYRHSIPGNWKLYHENLRDPYHATLLHSFLVTFGLLAPGNRSMMLMDPHGRHGVMASAKSDAKTMSSDTKKEMRAYREDMTLKETRFMDFIEEFDSPWSVTMATIWPNLIVQREMNTLGIRQIIPTGPHEFIMKWTMFGFEDDSEEMLKHRLRQGNLMGPAGFLGLEDNEAIKFVQDGMQRVPNGKHLVKLDPANPAGTANTVISESAIRAMYRYWRQEMNI